LAAQPKDETDGVPWYGSIECDVFSLHALPLLLARISDIEKFLATSHFLVSSGFMKANSQNPHLRQSLTKGFAMITAVALAAGSALAAQNTWTDGTGDDAWGSAGNWSGGVPAAADQLILGDAPANTAQTINLGSNRTLENEILIQSTGSRDYTIQGNALDFVRTVTSPIGFESGAGTTDLTVDSDITISETVGSGNIYFDITGSGTRTISLNGDISLGTGTRPRSIRMDAVNTTLRLSGSNSVALRFVNGEVVAAGLDAVAMQWQQGGGNSLLSVSSDLNAGSTTGAGTYLTANLDLRIVSETPSSADRVLTFVGRLNGQNPNGTLTLVSNVNSTGRIILNSTNSHPTAANDLAINLGTSGLMRFSSAGYSIYGPGLGLGILSGQGDVEVVGSGTVSLRAVNTYSGSTSISNNSTLQLTDAGSIGETFLLRVDAGSTFEISGITATGYTFDTDQTVAGAGTIVTGGKNLILNGTLAPGSSPGTLTVDLGAGTFSLGAATDLQFELGTASDLVNLTSAAGTLDIGSGTLDFSDFTFTDGAGFGVGQYTLFQNAGLKNGSFGTTTGSVGGFAGELMFSGNNLILDVSVIPEPGTASLLLLGGLSVLLVRRKRL